MVNDSIDVDWMLGANASAARLETGVNGVFLFGTEGVLGLLGVDITSAQQKRGSIPYGNASALFLLEPADYANALISFSADAGGPV